jgi:hypothetical protein
LIAAVKVLTIGDTCQELAVSGLIFLKLVVCQRRRPIARYGPPDMRELMLQHRHRQVPRAPVGGRPALMANIISLKKIESSC